MQEVGVGMGGCPSGGVRASFDTAAAQPTEDVAAGQDARAEGLTGRVERALAELGIEWKNVMAFGVHSDRVVIIEGPVGYERTWWSPEGRAQAGGEGWGAAA
jgi:hypothetical protein